jgi:hypothetical protein
MGTGDCDVGQKGDEEKILVTDDIFAPPLKLA